MNRIVKIIVYFLICFVSGSNSLLSQHLKFGFEINNEKRSAGLPFQLINNLMVVDILFEGVIPLKFIIDTGVSNTVLIEKSFADILAIEPDRKLTLIGAAGGKEVEAFIVNSVSIKLKGITGSHIPLLVLKEDYLNLQESMGIKVHGILGYDLFKNFVVKIDYENSKVIFFEPEKFNKKFWFYKEMPLSVENTKPYLFQNIMMEDSSVIKAKLMIDTGASHSLMLHQNSNEIIKLPKNTIRDILGAGIAGEIEGHIGRINRLDLGGNYIMEDVLVTYPDEGTYNEVIENTARNGTIGGGILKRFSVYLDYQEGKMFIRKNRSYKKKFTYDMSGLSIATKGELFLNPYYVIDSVRPNTPAERVGLKKNDIIMKMNGMVGSELNIVNMNDILTSKAGKKVRIKVKRGEQILQMEFMLEKII